MDQSNDKKMKRKPRLQEKKPQPPSISAIVGGLIGLFITGIFAAVIMTVVVMALRVENETSAQLLHTAMTMVASALGAVLGYFYATRGTRR